MNTCIHIFSTIKSLEDFIEDLNTDKDKDLLVQIFATQIDLVELKNIHRTITSTIPKASIIGAFTSTNISTLNTKYTNMSTNGTLITFTSFSKSSFRIFAYNLDYSHAPTLGKEFVKNELTCLSKLAVIYSNINPLDCENILSTIKIDAPKLIISGGIVPNYENEKLFANDRFYNKGIVGFVIDSSCLNVHSFYNTNFMSIGKPHAITSAKDNIIKTINHMPAKAFYEKYLGKVPLDNFDDLGYIFPLLIHDKDEINPKPMLNITEEGHIVTNTSVKDGDLLTLGYGNMQTLINNNNEIINNLKNIPVENLIVFSGLIRQNAHQKFINYSITKEIPIGVFGIFTEAEFVTNGEKSYVSIGSTCVTAISEEKDFFIKDPEAYYNINTNNYNEQTILLNLVENTSKELNVINQTLENIVTQKTNELLNHYYIDELTKLPNINKLNETISNNKAKSLAFIDISSFVNINNFYGNFIGNKILTELSRLIAAFCFNHDYLAYRIHSDIFAISSDDKDNELFNNNILLLQDKIHKYCFMELSLEIYILTVIAISHNKNNIYENTSMTLEYAKGQKTPFLIYDENLKIEESIKNNLIWTSKIRNAIEKNRIIPYYQPIYNNITQKTDHFEVLMRLIDDDNTIVTPNNFLEIAKKTNLYTSLTKIIVEKAFENFKNTNLRFSINLSAEDILNKNIRQYIYKQLEKYPKANNVIFELVESEGIENYDDVKDFINTVKTYGVQVAIDDFGTGFSNFHYLFKLNVDLIKIDGSIIQQINSETAASLVAETIVDFSKKMNIETVAEFVSDEQIFNKANQLGINYSQGYYISIPLEKTH